MVWSNVCPFVCLFVFSFVQFVCLSVEIGKDCNCKQLLNINGDFENLRLNKSEQSLFLWKFIAYRCVMLTLYLHRYLCICILISLYLHLEIFVICILISLYFWMTWSKVGVSIHCIKASNLVPEGCKRCNPPNVMYTYVNLWGGESPETMKNYVVWAPELGNLKKNNLLGEQI